MTVEVGTEKFPAKATIVEDGPYRDELYAKLVAIMGFRRLRDQDRSTHTGDRARTNAVTMFRIYRLVEIEPAAADPEAAAPPNVATR